MFKIYSKYVQNRGFLELFKNFCNWLWIICYYKNSRYLNKQYSVLNSVLLLTHLKSCTKISDLAKMTFSNSIQLKIIITQDKIAFIKTSTVFGTEAVLKMTCSNSIWLKMIKKWDKLLFYRFQQFWGVVKSIRTVLYQIKL